MPTLADSSRGLAQSAAKLQPTRSFAVVAILRVLLCSTLQRFLYYTHRTCPPQHTSPRPSSPHLYFCFGGSYRRRKSPILSRQLYQLVYISQTFIALRPPLARHCLSCYSLSCSLRSGSCFPQNLHRVHPPSHAGSLSSRPPTQTTTLPPLQTPFSCHPLVGRTKCRRG